MGKQVKGSNYYSIEIAWYEYHEDGVTVARVMYKVVGQNGEVVYPPSYGAKSAAITCTKLNKQRTNKQ